MLVTEGLLPRIKSCEVLSTDVLPPKWSDHAGKHGACYFVRCAVTCLSRVSCPFATLTWRAQCHGTLGDSPRPSVCAWHPRRQPTPFSLCMAAGILLELEGIPDVPTHPPCAHWARLKRRFGEGGQKTLLGMFARTHGAKRPAAAAAADADAPLGAEAPPKRGQLAAASSTMTALGTSRDGGGEAGGVRPRAAGDAAAAPAPQACGGSPTPSKKKAGIQQGEEAMQGNAAQLRDIGGGEAAGCSASKAAGAAGSGGRQGPTKGKEKGGGQKAEVQQKARKGKVDAAASTRSIASFFPP